MKIFQLNKPLRQICYLNLKKKLKTFIMLHQQLNQTSSVTVAICSTAMFVSH